MSAVTISRPSPEDVLVRLKNSGNSDELNIEGKSYRPDRRGAFFVERKHVSRELLTVGGFYPAPITKQESLQDVASSILAMPECQEKVALKAALAALFEPGDGT